MEEYNLPEIENKENNESERNNYLKLENGYLIFRDGKLLGFGQGANTIKIDNTLGLWAGNQIYSQSKFRVSSSGTVERIVLENQLTLPTTGIVGELAVSGGSLYICTVVSPITWSKVGLQT